MNPNSYFWLQGSVAFSALWLWEKVDSHHLDKHSFLHRSLQGFYHQMETCCNVGSWYSLGIYSCMTSDLLLLLTTSFPRMCASFQLFTAIETYIQCTGLRLHNSPQSGGVQIYLTYFTAQTPHLPSQLGLRVSQGSWLVAMLTVCVCEVADLWCKQDCSK